MITYTHQGPVRTLAWSSDGRLLSIAGSTVYVYTPDGDSEPIPLGPHLSDVCDAAFSPDCSLVATVSSDFGVRLFDSDTGEQIALLKGHMASAKHVLWSPDGAHIATSSQDGTVRVWDVSTRQAQYTMEQVEGAFDLVIVPGDTWTAACACGNGSVRIWNLETGALVLDLPGIPKPAGYFWAPVVMTPSPDGRWLFISARGQGEIWDLQRGTRHASTQQEGICEDVAWSPDSKTLVLLNTRSSVVALMDLDLAPVQTLIGHQAAPICAVFGDEDTLLTGAEDTTIRLWSLSEGRALCQALGHVGAVQRIALSPATTQFASMANDQTVRVWSLLELDEVHPTAPGLGPDGSATPLYCLEHPDTVAVAALPDGRIVTACAESVRFWSGQSLDAELSTACGLELHLAASGERLLYAHNYDTATLIDCRNSSVLAEFQADKARFTPDGRLVLLPHSDSSHVRFADAVSGEVVWDLGSRNNLLRISEVSPDSTRLVVGGDTLGTVALWDLQNRVQVAELDGHEHGVSRGVFSSDSRWLATLGGEKIHVWNAGTGARAACLDAARWGMLAWRPQSDTLVFSYDGVVGLWSPTDGAVVVIEPDAQSGRPENINNLVCSPCGSYALAGGDRGSVSIVQLDTRAVVPNHLSTNAGGQFSPDGGRLVVWSRTSPWTDRLLKLLEPETGETVAVLTGHNQTLQSQGGGSFHFMSFSADSSRLATVMWHDDRVRLWRTSDGALLGILPGHGQNVRDIAWSLDQRLMYTTGKAGVYVWDASDPWAVTAA